MKIRYTQPPPGYSYFPGNEVDDKSMDRKTMQSHVDAGYAVPVTDSLTESPEARRKRPEQRA